VLTNPAANRVLRMTSGAAGRSRHLLIGCDESQPMPSQPMLKDSRGVGEAELGSGEALMKHELETPFRGQVK